MASKSNPPLYKSYLWPALLLVCLLFLTAFVAKMPSISMNYTWCHGFAHPLEGWDHIVTMITVGIWAAQLRGHSVWLLPIAFVGVMSLGGIAGTAGILLPAVEGIILLSCAVFSLFIIRRIKFSSRVNLLIVAFFAFFHGFAHGQEISASASLISYSVGFMLATLLLHGAGILVAKLILFCLTCLIAVLLPNLAQAAQSQSVSKSNGNLNPVKTAYLDYNLPCDRSIKDYFPPQERTVDDSFNITFLNLCGIIPDKPDPASQTLKQRSKLNHPTHKSKTKRFDNTIGKLSLIDDTNIAALTAMPPHLALIRNDASPNFAADFKHFYPDINYTPGQVLLSNGTGATSPPLALTARFPILTTRLYHAHLISSVEVRALQPTFTDSTKGLFALISTSTTPPFNCVVGLTDNSNTSFRPNRTLTFTIKGRGGVNGEMLYLYPST
jgi:urease accessory protein